MMTRFAPYAFLIIVIGMLPGCTQQIKSLRRSMVLSSQEKAVESYDTDEPHPITIYIHGTRLVPHGVLETFFHSEPGLHHYTYVNRKYKQRRVAESIISSDPTYFAAEGFYLFGWSGSLSFEVRYKAARELYEQLRTLRKRYSEQYGHEPTIRIITHSHGGNLALNLACVVDADDPDFAIEELILLACPVQKCTACYSKAPVFKQIYSLYSSGDVIQIIDPQGLYTRRGAPKIPTFSQRCFEHHDTIEQIVIEIDRRAPLHIDFIRSIFLSHLATILHTIKEWQQEMTMNDIDWHHAPKTLCLYNEKFLRKTYRKLHRN